MSSARLRAIRAITHPILLLACFLPNAELRAETTETSTTAKKSSISPPRVDGAYVGGSFFANTMLSQVNFATPLLWGGGGSFHAGQSVFPWLTLGFEAGYAVGYGSQNGLRSNGSQGGLLIEVGFLPLPRFPFSIRLGAGVGGGRVSRENLSSGFGGAMFKATLRYEFFPTAAKKRPNIGGGWSIGPELGWIGNPPTSVGGNQNNNFFLGLWTGYYFGH